MKKFTKILMLLIALVITVTAFTVVALATEGEEGQGTILKAQGLI